MADDDDERIPETSRQEEDFLTLRDFDDDDDDDDDDDEVNDEEEATRRLDSTDLPPISFDKLRDLPPWMSQHVDRRRTNHVVALHNEIVGFCKLMEPHPEEMKERDDLVLRFTALAQKVFKGCKVQVFGSQATGLCLPDSDIDIVIQLNEGTDAASDTAKDGKNSASTNKPTSKEQELKDMENWDVPTGSPLDRLAECLREEWLDDLTYLEVIANTRVPLVKFTHGPTNIDVDVCFNMATGVQAAKLMHEYMDALPPLRPLTFVLKYFLAARGLNQPYTGGIGSFMLQMMIVSFLQHRERDFVHNRVPVNFNLGALLLEFLELYSMDFNYITVGVSVRFDGYFFPKGATDRKEHFWQPSRPFSFAMENPLDPTQDVGAPSFRMSLIQRSFEIAFKVLLSHVTEPAQPAASILASVLPPTDEMRKRVTLNRLKPLSAPRHAGGGGGSGGHKNDQQSRKVSEPRHAGGGGKKNDKKPPRKRQRT